MVSDLRGQCHVTSSGELGDFLYLEGHGVTAAGKLMGKSRT